MADQDIEQVDFATLAVKALTDGPDWALDVLAAPFDSRDSDGQWFDARTDYMLDHFKTPVPVYYHSLKKGGGFADRPEVLGQTTDITVQPDGIHARVVLNKLSEAAGRVWEAAKRGMAAVSSGSIQHLARLEQGGRAIPYSKDTPGRIAVWPLGEISIWDIGPGMARQANPYAVAVPALKAVYQQAGIVLPDNLDSDSNGDDATGAKAQSAAAKHESGEETKNNKRGNTMAENENDKQPVVDIDALVNDKINAALEKASAKAQADRDAKEAEDKRVADAVKAEREKWEAEAAKSRRLPFGADDAPVAAKYGATRPFDHLTAGDTAVLIGTLQSAKKPVSEGALKALAIKVSEDKTEVGDQAQYAMKVAGLDAAKANEMDYSTLASGGDEWVGIAYSTSLWEAIRVQTFVVGKLPQIEVPQGFESIYLPLEATDPTWYVVAETTSSNTAQAAPVPTVTASTLPTGRVQLTLNKLGARVVWSGELDEGSLIPFAPQLRMQLGKSGAEYLESAIIDGDTTTSATTNINDIGGTPAATDWFMAFNGFRKSPLVTTTANSRSAGGSLDVTDYLETVKLMGGAGINALDRNAVGFIVDPNTYYKTLALPEVLTRDSFASPTLEGGQLTGLWGYQIAVSGSMHKASSVRKANTAGKVDQDTVGNNTTGSILAVRYDQWKFGWRRRMTMETTRFANSDSNEIVAMVRCGLIQRDSEASAISYNVGV